MTNRSLKLAAVAVAATAWCGVGLAPAMADQITMKLSTPTIFDVMHQYYKQLKTNIEKRSGGRIKVQIYPKSQLGPIPQVIEGVALGTIEASSAASGFWVSLEPRFEVFDAPGLFKSVVHGNKVLRDPAIAKRLATFGVGKGVEILGIGVYSPTMVLAHKPISSVADFKGRKIRTLGGAPIQVDPFRTLGALPVSLPLSEVLPAMQNRAIDGMVAAMGVYVAFKYYDVAKPTTYLPSTFLVSPILVNRKFMKSLGPKLEAIVREEARKADGLFSTWGVGAVKRMEGAWRKNGGKIVSFSPQQSKLYLSKVTPVVTKLLSNKPMVKADYDALLAASERIR